MLVLKTERPIKDARFQRYLQARIWFGRVTPPPPVTHPFLGGLPSFLGLSSLFGLSSILGCLHSWGHPHFWVVFIFEVVFILGVVLMTLTFDFCVWECGNN